MPALQQLARTSDSLVGRFHAMWTLEGLGALDAALVREQMKDPNPRMRIQAIRASESLYKAGNRTFDADYRAMAEDPDTDVSIQAMLTLSVLQGAGPRRGRQERAGREQGARREGDRRFPAEAAGRGRRRRRRGADAGGAESDRRRRRRSTSRCASAATATTAAARRKPAPRRARRWRPRSPGRRASTGTATTSSRCSSKG